jgi:hypothetical protein
VNASDKTAFNLLVAGDVVVDHHIYEGERSTPTVDAKRGVRDWRELGGADLVRRLLAELFVKAKELADQDRAAKEKEAENLPAEKRAAKIESIKKEHAKEVDELAWQTRLGVTTPALDENPCSHHGFAIWQPYPAAGGKELVWRAHALMGYGHTQSAAQGGAEPHCPQYPMQPVSGLPIDPRILVLDDAGSLFRNQPQKDCWLLPKKGQTPPDWILLKMSRPIAQGDLWYALIEDFADRLVCVVSADELRHECVSLSRGLSWERTVEEMRDGLLNKPALAGLNRCRHLIVSFESDGALWVDRSKKAEPRAVLCYDAGSAEGEWADRIEGRVMGGSATRTAAIAYALARHVSAGGARPLDLLPAIEAGLASVRNLHERGHGLVGEKLPTGYPVTGLAKVILKPATSFARAVIPWPRQGAALPTTGKTWMIVETSQRPLGSKTRPSLVGLARQVVLQGHPALMRLPHARFGKLITADRSEIETLRNLRRLMICYRELKRAAKPLSLGVFGPPGAGKSFGVKQLATEVFGAGAWLEFNLSQFDADDLMGAFHQVRDLVLSGVAPVVFWDEFDSREYEWLQYLLAPMQDGRFQEGQLNHAIGKCVFVFAGGTSPTFEEFGPPDSRAEKEAQRRFKLRKGPDFLSRLDAYYNVAGPNRRTLPSRYNPKRPDPNDVCYPLRRALLIRGLLGCGPDERLDFDSDLLDALLLAPNYRHGSRSLEKLVSSLRPANGEPIRRSSLPAAAQLAMHVDPEAFAAILNRNESFKMSEMIETLAEGIHETWRALAAKEGWKMQPQFDKSYEDLAPIDKEDNRAAARRIPEILALAGMGIAGEKEPASSEEPSGAAIRAHLEHHLERLAEAEHDGWMEQRLKNGWRYGEPRDDANKIHPLLIPYARLPEKEKNKDRNSVRHFPDMVAKAGYRIVWLKG